MTEAELRERSGEDDVFDDYDYDYAFSPGASPPPPRFPETVWDQLHGDARPAKSPRAKSARRKGDDEVLLSRLEQYAPYTMPRPPTSAYQREFAPSDDDFVLDDVQPDYEYTANDPLPAPPALQDPEATTAVTKRRRRRRQERVELPPLPLGEAVPDEDARYDWRAVAPSRRSRARGKRWYPTLHVDRVQPRPETLSEGQPFFAEVTKYIDQ
jgi:hypothetical protein